MMVVLAQLAEHRIVVPSVVGSSPTFHPNRCKTISYSDFLCHFFEQGSSNSRQQVEKIEDIIKNLYK